MSTTEKTTETAAAPAPAAAVQTPTPTPAVDHEAAFKARAKAITELCALAGAPQLAGEFLAKGATEEQVRAQLLEQRAKGDGPEVRGQIPDNAAQNDAQRRLQSPGYYRSVMQRWNDPAALAKQANQN